ncbi:unnamed protein product [Prorocentrum cordatum]|uniref:CASP-like protein n=1 Tax=Prorocentrum cordatum TaxID=2364126 RepID=A0ABN9U731_9DINO|nr:unnamed protein product [Polarella glacialis]
MEARCNNAGLHVQVQAMGSMLKHANQGREWGIKVSQGVALNKDFLQAVCIRAALLTTAAVAFLGSPMDCFSSSSSFSRLVFPATPAAPPPPDLEQARSRAAATAAPGGRGEPPRRAAAALHRALRGAGTP